MPARRKRTRLLDVVEAGYRIGAAEQAWVAGVAESTWGLLGDGYGATAFTVHSSPEAVSVSSIAHAGQSVPDQSIVEVTSRRGAENPEGLDRFYRSVRVSSAVTGLTELGQHEEAATVAEYYEGFGFKDGVGVNVHEGGPTVAVLFSCLDSVRRPTPTEQRRWGLLSCHLANALRLRRVVAETPDQAATDERRPYVEALLTTDGRVEYAEGPAASEAGRASLREAVRTLDRARSSLSTREPDESLELWRGLCAGRWSLVDRFDGDGRRYVVACRNDLPARSALGLSTRECQVALLASLGRSNDEVAYELGIALSTVGTHLANALEKLGVPNRAALSSVRATIEHGHSRRFTVNEAAGLEAFAAPDLDPALAERLTPSERDVVRMVLAGKDNASIARARGSSVRTVANQVAAVLRKTGTQTRSDLAATLSRGGPAEQHSKN
ncbi:MAG: response regulator transcription factor [Nannocystaceae bacterium]|nr:helix-turn-helix transcriptional regulator [bacterium]